MNLTIFDNLMNLERDFDRLLSGHAGPSFIAPTREFAVMDIADEGNEIAVTLDLPGVRKEDLKITLHNGLLTVSGERRKPSAPEQAKWIRNETWDGSFSRSVQLPRLVKTDAISAELQNGVLRVLVPKAEEARPREVVIR